MGATRRKVGPKRENGAGPSRRIRRLAAAAALTALAASPAAAQPAAEADEASRDAILNAAEQALGAPQGPAPDAAPGLDLPPIQRPSGRPIPRTLDSRPAAQWRLLDGDGVVGVLRLSDVAEAEDGPVGFWVARIVGRGVVEGVYNLKDNGRAAVGVFWPEGLLNGDVASGFLDLRLQGERGVGRGRISFTGEDQPPLEVFAR